MRSSDSILRDQRALIFASSKGLGYSAAEAMARHGAAVCLNSRSEERGRDAVRRLRQDVEKTADLVVADLSKRGEAARAVDEAAQRMGGLDILVINSGGPKPGGFSALDDKDWEEALQALLMSPIRAIEAALPYFRKNETGGSILCVSSVSSIKPIKSLTLSNVIRPSVEGLVRTVAAEFARENVSANAICPGRIYTSRMEQIIENAAKSKGTEFKEEKVIGESEIALGKFGDPAEFGEYLAFLASPPGRYITGQTLIFDGGLLNGGF